MMIYFLFDILIAAWFAASLYAAWRQGLVYMLLRLALWAASLIAACYLASKFGSLANLAALFGLSTSTQSSFFFDNWVLLFCVSFVVFRLAGRLILRGIGYGKVRGIFSLANHLAGLGAGVIMAAINLLILCSFLQTGLIPGSQEYLARSWLKPASAIVEQVWNEGYENAQFS
jgi:hypothetical protein